MKREFVYIGAMGDATQLIQADRLSKIWGPPLHLSSRSIEML
jgi:hypothetical protein